LKLPAKILLYLAAIYPERTSVRRKRRCYYSPLPGPPKKKNILICCFLLFGCIGFYSQAFCQLTYQHLLVQLDSPWTCGKLQLIPVRFKDPGFGEIDFAKGSVIGFAQALREGKLTVKETNTPGGDDVSLLEVKNHSKKTVLVNSGEIVAGGMQDRAIGATALLEPDDKETLLPVFCIEKGRWQKKSRGFRYAGSADAELRKEIDVAKKQNKVWKEIDRQLIDKGIQNVTGAYIDLYKDTASVDTACLRFFKQQMIHSDSAYAGFVAVTGNRIINCELFGSSTLCTASYETMLQSYMRSITAADANPQVPKVVIQRFTDKFMENEEKQIQYLNKHGRLYTSNERVLHLIAYDE
jgi:hypothetical protein